MTGEHAAGYWYARKSRTGPAVLVLNAMRDYRASEFAMRRRTRRSMRLGETDMAALRMLIAAKRSGNALSPKDLARDLGISSASTTILVDRLVKSGHVVRLPHPSDRRGIIVESTTATDEQIRATLGAMHERMLGVATSLPDADAQIVMDFFVAMRRAVDEGL